MKADKMRPEVTMVHPDNTPVVFVGQKKFVELHGLEVWSELCDTCQIGVWYAVEEVAKQLDCIRHYRNPKIYLRVVLKAIEADYKNRPDDYEHKPPFVQRDLHLRWFML